MGVAARSKIFNPWGVSTATLKPMDFLVNMKSGIYKITSPTGRVYIGQTNNFNVRFNTYRRSGCEYQTRLKRSFIKYGFENHKIEVIEECCIEFLNNRERYWQDFYQVLDRKKGLNCILTKSDEKPRVVSDETRKKYSEAGLKRASPSKETREKISDSLKGRIFTDQWKKRLSEGRKNPSKETRLKISESRKYFTHTPETKLKISQSGMGRKMSQLTLSKLIERSSCLVVNLETGIFYDSIKEAHCTLKNINYSTFVSNLNGTRKVNKTSFLHLGGEDGTL